ncbi:MAG: phage terminase large subunit [Cypionkella sp.]
MIEAAKLGVGISAIPIIPNSDKDLRIERLQPPISAGLIRLHPTQQTLIDQLQQWPNADHDDGPDALDMLWQNALLYSGGASAGGGGQPPCRGQGRDAHTRRRHRTRPSGRSSPSASPPSSAGRSEP